MWKKFVHDYLRFSRKDRNGILVLIALILMVVILPVIWPAKKMTPPSPQEIEKIKAISAHLRTTDSSSNEKKFAEPGGYASENKYPAAHTEVFYFDPNTLDAAGWKRLGIRDKTTATIQHFLQKGGKFKKPEDIGKIYGLFKDDYERLLPYVRIQQSAAQPAAFSADDKPAYASTPGKEYPKTIRPVPKNIEINTADTTAFIALPGIGAKLAARIVSFRDKLGGFYSVKQVAETYGLPDSTYTRIEPMLQCNPALVQQVNINTADANLLKQHPYIRWNLANAIVQYRGQHGNFKSVDQLRLLSVITADIFDKMKHYVVVE